MGRHALTPPGCLVKAAALQLGCKRITCQKKHWDTHADTFWLSNFMRRWEGTCGVKSFIP